jgi:SAM-dependent methyltransferase
MTKPDLAAATEQQKRTWSTGDFAVVAPQIQPVSDALVRAVDPHPDQRVLDVACGSGNTAISAARRYCRVTGLDFVPALLDSARRRAQAEGVAIEVREGDAQALPFEAASFDVVLSTFGVIFAPDEARAAAELARVCRPGGKIGLASWPSDGMVGNKFFQVHASFMPPPSSPPPLSRWGTEAGVRELLGPHTSEIHFRRGVVTEYFRSPEHGVEVFEQYFGPTRATLERLDPPSRPKLLDALLGLFREENTATDGTLILPLDYLEVVAVRR